MKESSKTDEEKREGRRKSRQVQAQLEEVKEAPKTVMGQLGGAIFGVAGVLFAPQLSKTFLKGKDAAGRFLYDDYESDEDADAALERTRNDLNEKIAQLNAAIDTFAGEADKGLRDGDDDGDDDEGVENENENDEKAEATAGKISGE